MQYINQLLIISSNYGMFNSNHVKSNRHEILERPQSVLNMVAAKLVERNQDAECQMLEDSCFLSEGDSG